MKNQQNWCSVQLNQLNSKQPLRAGTYLNGLVRVAGIDLDMSGPQGQFLKAETYLNGLLGGPWFDLDRFALPKAASESRNLPKWTAWRPMD